MNNTVVIGGKNKNFLAIFQPKYIYALNNVPSNMNPIVGGPCLYKDERYPDKKCINYISKK